MNIIPEYLIGALFCKKSTIAFSNSRFHKAFYKMKKNEEYTDLFENIPFSGSPVNPYSEVLDEALFNLQFAGALSRRNPELVVYSTTNNFQHTYQILAKNISAPTLKKVDKLCADILKILDNE